MLEALEALADLAALRPRASSDQTKLSMHDLTRRLKHAATLLRTTTPPRATQPPPHEASTSALLATIATLAPAATAPHATLPTLADESIPTRELNAAASELLDALADAADAPILQLRRERNGAICRILHEALRDAEAEYPPLRARRLVRALAASVCALPRPHLSRSTDSHKLIPLLLGWADELIDPLSRAAALYALRHCFEELPAAEVQWHGLLLLSRLRALLVFRDEPVLEQLLPAFVAAWRVVVPALDDAARCEQTSLTVAELERELMYVSSRPESRRVYARVLPDLFALIGLGLCTHLPAIVDGCCEILDEEMRLAVHGTKVAANAVDVDTLLLPARHAVRLLEGLLLSVWPRAVAHGPKVLRHVVVAFLRAEVLVGVAPSAGVAHVESAGLVGEVRQLFRVFCSVGAEGAALCDDVVAAVRVRAPPYFQAAFARLEAAACGGEAL